MNKYQQGDSEMFNRVKSIMSSMGIDENDLAGKSPEEIEDFYVVNLVFQKVCLKTSRKV
ncbi:MAG: hypothetical protein ACLRQF_03685 [Thomasclavelia ramosa]